MTMQTMPNTRAADHRTANAPAPGRRTGPRTGSPCYLLFAGVAHRPPRGGLGDLVRTFTCEEAAREAFHELRVQRVSKGTWAQLAMIDVQSGVRPVCWFGTEAAGRAQHVSGGSTDEGASQSAATRKLLWMERYGRRTRRGAFRHTDSASAELATVADHGSDRRRS